MTRLEQAARLRTRQRALWEEGHCVPAESLLAEDPLLAAQAELAVELVYHEVLLREARGEQPRLEEYVARFPQYADLLHSLFELHAALEDPAVEEICATGRHGGVAGDTGRPGGARACQSGDEGERAASGGPAPLVASGGADRLAGPGEAIPPPRQVAAGSDERTGEQEPAAIGRYRVLGLVGSGAFGTVYHGYDPHLDRHVAIKVPHASRPGPNVSGATASAEDFLREMRRAAGLRHPGIVTVYDVVAGPDTAYMVSEYVSGTDLARRLAAGRPSYAEAAAWVAEAAEALHAAHEQGLIHRDIKPGNILIDESGHARITDFGLAFSMHSEAPPPGWAGTPQYMAPEQIFPESVPVDRRSDVYSLGLVFYELLTGQLPYQAASWQELLNRLAERVIAPPRWVDARVPRRLERICMKALAWDRQQRYPTAQEFAEELKAWLAWTAAQGGGASLAEAAGPADRLPASRLVPEPARRNAASWLVIALAASFALVAWLGAGTLRSLVPRRAAAVAAQPPRNPPVGQVLPCDSRVARLLAADLAAAAPGCAAEAVACCQQAPLAAIPQLQSRAVRLKQAVDHAAAAPQGVWLPLAAEARALESLAGGQAAAETTALTGCRRLLDALAALELGPPGTATSWLPTETVLVVATDRLPEGRVASLGANCLAMGDELARRPSLDECTLAAALRLPLMNEPPAPEAAPPAANTSATVAVTLDNTRNPHPFSCLVAGRQAVIPAGQFEVFPAAGLLEVVFDPGRPGPAVRKLLPPGTYRIGVRGDLPAWDVFGTDP